jgi:hypothetical protein
MVAHTWVSFNQIKPLYYSLFPYPSYTPTIQQLSMYFIMPLPTQMQSILILLTVYLTLFCCLPQSP